MASPYQPRTAREPQFPQKCVLPESTTTSTSSSQLRGRGRHRRLIESTVTKDTAQDSCAFLPLGSSHLEHCVHDVMVTGDLDVANDYK